MAVRPSENVRHGLPRTCRTSLNTMVTPSFNKAEKPFNAPNPKPGTPLVLSPTGTASTASSPGAINYDWDTPESTDHYRKTTSGDLVSTPLTPPTTCERPAKKRLMNTIKHVATTGITTTSNISPSEEADEDVERLQDEDYFFKPKKLIRNLTKELQASESQQPEILP
jgi:hypothetical protein